MKTRFLILLLILSSVAMVQGQDGLQALCTSCAMEQLLRSLTIRKYHQNYCSHPGISVSILTGCTRIKGKQLCDCFLGQRNYITAFFLNNCSGSDPSESHDGYNGNGYNGYYNGNNGDYDNGDSGR